LADKKAPKWGQPVINPYRVKEIPPVLRTDIYLKNIKKYIAILNAL